MQNAPMKSKKKHSIAFWWSCLGFIMLTLLDQCIEEWVSQQIMLDVADATVRIGGYLPLGKLE